MRIITRTLIYEILGAIAEGAVLFTFVFLLKRFFNITELFVTSGSSMMHVLTILFAILPSIMLMTLPMAVLLAHMLVYGRLAHDNELTALQAAGYSTIQLLKPALIVGLVLTFMLLWWGQRIAPKGIRIVRETAADILQNTATAGLQPGRINYLGNYNIYCNSIKNDEMRQLNLFEKKDGRIAGVISAPTGTIHYDPAHQNIMFHMQNGMLHQMPSPDKDIVIRFQTMNFSLSIPKLLNILVNIGSDEYAFSYDQLKEEVLAWQSVYDREAQKEPRTDQIKQTLAYYFKEWKEKEIELMRRISLPFACLFMAFIGALLGMESHTGWRSASYALTILVIFIYYILLSFAKAMTLDGQLPAWFAMWIPNLIVMMILTYLFVRTRKVR